MQKSQFYSLTTLWDDMAAQHLDCSIMFQVPEQQSSSVFRTVRGQLETGLQFRGLEVQQRQSRRRRSTITCAPTPTPDSPSQWGRRRCRRRRLWNEVWREHERRPLRRRSIASERKVVIWGKTENREKSNKLGDRFQLWTKQALNILGSIRSETRSSSILQWERAQHFSYASKESLLVCRVRKGGRRTKERKVVQLLLLHSSLT